MVLAQLSLYSFKSSSSMKGGVRCLSDLYECHLKIAIIGD